jgi:hypothetical protein
MADIIITVVSGETVDLGLAVPGVQGPVGGGSMPSGGVAGDIMVKQSSVDYDAAWGAEASGITFIVPTISGGTMEDTALSSVSIASSAISGGTIFDPTLSGSASTGGGFVLGGPADTLAFFGGSAIVQPSGIVIPSGGSSVDEVGAVVSGIIIALQDLGLLGA